MKGSLAKRHWVVLLIFVIVSAVFAQDGDSGIAPETLSTNGQDKSIPQEYFDAVSMRRDEKDKIRLFSPGEISKENAQGRLAFGFDQVAATEAEVLEEVLELLGTVVIDRAQKQALGVIQHRIADMLASVKDDEDVQIFPRTEQYLRTVSLILSLSDPDDLLDVLFTDIAEYLENEDSLGVLAPLSSIVSESIVAGTIDLSRLQSYLFLVLTEAVYAESQLEKEQEEIQQAIQMGIAYLKAVDDGKWESSPYDFALQITEFTDMKDLKIQAEVLDTIHTVYKAFTAVDDNDVPDVKVRLSMILDLGISASRIGQSEESTVVPQKFGLFLRSLIDENYILAFSYLIEAIEPGVTGDKKMEKGMMLISTILEIAETFQLSDGSVPDKDSEEYQARFLERKEALELLIDATTSRALREREWILSLGGSLGIAYQRQFVDTFGNEEEDRSDTFGAMLPLGIGIQHIPKGPVGFHGMIYPFDLGQYVFLDQEELSLGDVSWQQVFTIGVQAGASLKIGSPDTLLLLSGHYQYAPLIDAEGGDGVGQWGISLSLYVPIFDFN